MLRLLRHHLPKHRRRILISVTWLFKSVRLPSHTTPSRNELRRKKMHPHLKAARATTRRLREAPASARTRARVSDRATRSDPSCVLGKTLIASVRMLQAIQAAQRAVMHTELAALETVCWMLTMQSWPRLLQRKRKKTPLSSLRRRSKYKKKNRKKNLYLQPDQAWSRSSKRITKWSPLSQC